MSYSDKPGGTELDAAISAEEHELVTEILRALRTMRYGSVVLTVHDGRLVEFQKTERIRRGVVKRAD